MTVSTENWLNTEKERLSKLSDNIFKVGSTLQILSRLAWPLSIKDEFFKNSAQRLPQVEYERFDALPVINVLNEVEEQLGDTPVDDWFRKQIEGYSNAANMLQFRGTQHFYDYSKLLYGKPTDPLRDEKTNSLGLAKRYLELLQPINKMKLAKPPEVCILAETLAERMKQATKTMFGDEAPDIQIVDDLSANALASSERVRIRRTASFSDNDIEQLVEHEIHIHVATMLNGKTKGNLSLLGLAHPSSTKTQEGLAVFAEYITSTLDLARMSRLADRVIATQMTIDGANFIDIYRYYLDKTDNPSQSYENTRRVFRGGVVEGRAPFTKDIVYLDGLLRVHNFLKAAVNAGRADSIHLLFAGRLDIEDLPVFSYLRALGLCQKPRFLPPWAKDLRILLCYLSYSSFLNTIDMSKVFKHYEDLLKDVG